MAYHEIGHALVAAKQSHSAPVQKITIIPRTSGALGYTMQVDEGNHYLMNQDGAGKQDRHPYRRPRRRGSWCSDSVTTGASNDIEQATKLARAMLTRYGMSQDFDMVALETVNNQYLGGDTSLACSAQTQREIDQKVVELVRAQHAKALPHPDRQPRQAGPAGHSILYQKGDHHRRGVHGHPERRRKN